MGYTCGARTASLASGQPHWNHAEQVFVRERDTAPESTTNSPLSRATFTVAATDPDDAPAAGFREGLPESYRSRHDVHYVEELTAGAETQPVRLLALTRIDAPSIPEEHTLGDLVRSIAKFGVLQPLLVRPGDGRFSLIAGRRRLAAARLAGLTAVPCLVHAVNDTRALLLTEAENLREESRPSASEVPGAVEVDEPIDPCTARVIGELQEAVTSVQACLQQMSPPTSTRDRIAYQLLAVEAARAEWLLRARQYLGSTRPVAHAPLRGVTLIDDVTRVAGALIALRGGTLHTHAVRGPLVVHGDQTLLSTAIVGLVWSLFAVGERVQDARVYVRLAARAGGGGPVLTITQPSAMLMQRALSRFFDSNWADRPGGAVAEIAAQLARHAAALHDARLDVSSRTGAGTRVTMTFET